MQGAFVIDLAGRLLMAAVLCFWLYRDSRSRDFSWLMWTLAPAMLVFLGRLAWVPAGLVIIGAYLGTRPKGKLLACPHCKKNVHEELAFCAFCRRSVKRECIRCHRTVPWDAVSCPHCRSTALTDS
ncbi:MAG: double zinc ribbon domain-containing protein [Bacteroidota bacterium]